MRAADLPADSSDDAWLAALAEEYLAAVRVGEAPDVEALCARNPARADEVRELLATLGGLEALREGGGDEEREIPLPERIGGFRPLREIGRGGMGVVWLATDESLERRVALKLLPPSAALDARYLRRFRLEAQAAAQLQHPNIVPVHEAGEDRGVPYFAMQFVDGQPLDRIVKRLREEPGLEGSDVEERTSEPDALDALARKLASRPLARSGAGWDTADDAGGGARTYHRNVAVLAKEVAEAVAYAHSRGILHRDLKPANLLLDEDGRVWVSDFGLCKRTGDEGPTATHDMVGTLRYMAPEQLDGHVDARSDVYALGLSLAHLLTRRTPFERDARARLLDAIRAGRIERPRRVDPSVPGDLDAIVRKATALLPEERYATAGEMAADLEAFLDGRPIAARPPSAWYLTRLVVRRHKLASAVLAAATALIVVLTTVYFVRIDSARALAEEREQEALAARDDAREAQAAARAEAVRVQVEKDTAEEALRFLSGLFEAGHPQFPRGHEVTARELLELGAARLDEEQLASPMSRARLQHVLGQVVHANGDPDRAVELLERAHAVFAAELGADDRRTLTTEIDIGRARFRMGRLEQSLRDLERAAERLERAFGPDDVDTLRARYRAGTVHETLGNLARAEKVLRDVDAELSSASEVDEELRLNVRYSLAQVVYNAGRFEEAAERLEAIVAERTTAHGASHLGTVQARMTLGVLRSRQGRHDEAIAELEACLALSHDLFTEDHPSIASCEYALARAYHRAGRLEESLELHGRSFERIDAAHGPRSDFTYIALATAAEIEVALRRADAAEGRYLDYLDRVSTRHGEASPEALRVLGELARWYWGRGLAREAEDALDACIAGLYDLPEAERTDLPAFLLFAGRVHRARQRPFEAEAALVEGLELGALLLDEANRLPALVAAELADLYRDEGRLDEAVPLWIRARERLRGLIGDDHPEVLALREALARAYVALERHDEARAVLERLVEVEPPPASRDTWLALLEETRAEATE